MKNKTLVFFLSCIVLMGEVSCIDSGFLDETVTTDLNREVVFSDSSYTAGFLTQIYNAIGFDTDPDRFNNGGGFQTMCDEAMYKQTATITTDMMFATGTINSQLVSKDAWEKCYANIRRVNVFLKYVDDSPIMESVKNQYKAEARFLRAWYYFILLKHYGGIPLLGDAIYEITDEMKTTRDSYEDCVNYIINECNEIISSNVLFRRRTGRDYGRISETACRALISRIRLYGASKLFNGISDQQAPTEDFKKLLGYPTFDQERWKLAYDAALAVIAMQEYRLFEWHKTGTPHGTQTVPEPGWGFYAVTTMPADFFQLTEDDIDQPGEYYVGGPYCEIILDKWAPWGRNREIRYGPPVSGGNGNNGYTYKEFADIFYMADGKPIEESIYKYNILEPNVNRDPRFINSVLYDGGLFCLGVGEESIGPVRISQGQGATLSAVHVGTPTGFYNKKTVSRVTCGSSFVGVPQARAMIRYAEILLNYAEAANEYYGPNHSDQYTNIYDALKAIRKRAGIEAGDDGMYGLKVGMSQDEMRELIRLERRIELAFEGHRFFDVRRWKIVEETDNRMMHGLEITLNQDGVRTAREFEVGRRTFRPAMYFWPIPYDEITKTPDLKQNPYYEVNVD